MKKVLPETLPLHEELPAEDETQELAEVIPIRTETTLTRYPFHRIAKKGDVQIKRTTKNGRGKVITTWEVKHPPGPLAYKIDTLIVNRRIDEMRSRGEIRQLFKLGSLREICEELKIAPNGTNINGIKEALRENAFAGITCKLDFTGNDGTTREFEFNTTRYTVIFTGEKLPNNRKADAVYIELHPRYHEMLRHSKTRPLNYEYLKALAPAPQRLYELLSFTMFGTLTHGRPNAQMLYSEFCQSAPLMRHFETKKMHAQMWKIHKPHKDAGYIKSVVFEETTDSDGAIDWIMKYTPGRRARYEYRAFTKKQEKLIEQKQAARPRLVAPAPKEKPAPPAEPHQTPEETSAIEKLMGLGIDQVRATQLVLANRAECELWADAWPYLGQKGMNNPAAILISFIERQRRPLPKEYLAAKEREAKQREQEIARQQQIAEDFYFEFFRPKFREFQREEFHTLQTANAEAFTTFATWLKKNHGRGLDMVSEEMQEKITLQRAGEFFTRVRPELGVRMTSFEEWDELHNEERREPLTWFAQNPHVIETLYR